MGRTKLPLGVKYTRRDLASVPNATWCNDGVIVFSEFRMACFIWKRSADSIDAVRSAMITMSRGLGTSLPHDPLQAAEATLPVLPSSDADDRAEAEVDRLVGAHLDRVALRGVPVAQGMAQM